MKQYLDPKPKNPKKPNKFNIKSKENQDLINTILFIIESFGIPVDQKKKLFKKSRKNGSIFFSCMWNKKNRRVKRM